MMKCGRDRPSGAAWSWQYRKRCSKCWDSVVRRNLMSRVTIPVGVPYLPSWVQTQYTVVSLTCEPECPVIDSQSTPVRDYDLEVLQLWAFSDNLAFFKIVIFSTLEFYHLALDLGEKEARGGPDNFKFNSETILKKWSSVYLRKPKLWHCLGWNVFPKQRIGYRVPNSTDHGSRVKITAFKVLKDNLEELINSQGSIHVESGR